jgi:uncharacterized membrane protein YbhN (UPF0104 family)
MRVPAWIRALTGPVILAALALTLDLDVVLDRLGTLEARWALAALGLGVVQTAVLAWRWRYTAGRLGLDLPFTTALKEYYLAVFLNQVLPGGVAGDAARAWRHAGRTDSGVTSGPAVRAVVLERASGQLVMAFAAAASVAAIGVRTGQPTWTVLGGGALLASVGSTLWARARFAAAGRASVLARVMDDAGTALLSPDALRVQVPTSALILASYVAVYLCAARAVGVETPAVVLGLLVPPVLMAMLVPVTVAGWGLREAAAAAVWHASGLGPADGVAISVAYGVLVLAGTIPGAVVLLRGSYEVPSLGGTRRSRSKSTS